ncbi:MAG: hypothetical protein JSV50_03505 [Desulfobacteraceae bacterium]|nr:MAG: hypothetical protein JSV50_03505 [Desulfobacteraceae bacterium]
MNIIFFKKRINYQILIILFSALFLVCLARPAASFWGPPPIPTWTSNINVGQNNLWGGYNYNDFQRLSNPYMFGPAIGIYYPYNTMFNIYDRMYGYNAGSMGFYNTGAGQQDVNSIGYPLPYAFTNQMGWINQAGFMGYPPVGNMGNIYNISYDPGAFTFDLGMDAYYTGIGNFWRQVFQDLKEGEKEK